MKDYYQNIISSIYAGISKILTFCGLLIFYFFLCDGITELSTKNEIARVLKYEISENSQQPDDSILVEKPYNCLNEEQFNNLLNATPSDSFNYHIFKFDNFNKVMLTRYNRTGNNLLEGIATEIDSSGAINSVNVYNLLFKSNEAFLKEILFRYSQKQNEFNQYNISFIEVPIIKYSLPKTFIPNILIIFIIIQLVKLLYSLKSLNYSIRKSTPIDEELKTLISFYNKQYLPSLNKVIFVYFIVLSLSLILIITLACMGLLFYKLEYSASDFFYTAHKNLGWLNVISTCLLTIWLYFKLYATKIAIDKIN